MENIKALEMAIKEADVKISKMYDLVKEEPGSAFYRDCLQAAQDYRKGLAAAYQIVTGKEFQY